MWPNPQFPADLITFTEEILDGKTSMFAQWFCKKDFSWKRQCNIFINFENRNSIEIFRRHIKGKYALKYFFRNMKMLKICFRDGLHLLGCCIGIILDSRHRKRNFSFNIFWVNVNKSTINFGFVRVY